MIVKSQDGMNRIDYNGIETHRVTRRDYEEKQDYYGVCFTHGGCTGELYGEYTSEQKLKNALDGLDEQYKNNMKVVSMPQDSEV